MNGHLHALHISDQAKGDRPPHITKMWCPATILIHRKFALACIGNRNQTFALRKIEDKRFLAQHMLACPKGRFDQRWTHGHVRGNIDDFNFRHRQQRPRIGRDHRIGEKFLAAILRRLPVDIAEGRYRVLGGAVGLEVFFRNGPATDQTNRRVRVGRVTRQIIDAVRVHDGITNSASFSGGDRSKQCTGGGSISREDRVWWARSKERRS